MLLTIKVWGIFFLFVLLGQLRVSGDTLENRFHAYINEVPQQKFFIQILSPLHALMESLGVDIDRNKIELIKNSTTITPSRLPQERIKQIRESMEQRRKILEENQ